MMLQACMRLTHCSKLTDLFQCHFQAIMLLAGWPA